ncbi:hypothetical protein HYT23_01320 [Candidatus Pacearchaeota archaeon]|nr:hypothetical protein [Candidatus Pacearchaeota archaeon]
MEEQKQQELMFKLAMYEQQIKQLNEQLEAVEKAIADSSSLSLNLENLKNGKEKEIVASIGKGIFARAKLISEELLVDIGGKNIVKKSIPEAQKLIGSQVNKLSEIKFEIEKNLEAMNSELMKMFLEAQEKQ